MNCREYYELYGEDKAELCRDPDDPGDCICSECGRPCRPVKVDYGIGAYEYQGAISYDHDWQWESPCCGAQVED